MNRREALTTVSAASAAFAATALAQTEVRVGTAKPPIDPLKLGWDQAKGEYVLPPLPYDKAALEPHIDAQTMEIHHDKHHAAYVAGLNKAMKELKNIRDGGGDASLIKHWSREVSFQGCGHVNHTLFWQSMAPAGKGGGGQPSGKLAEAITQGFGGFDKFVAQFKAAATQVEGGGWAWLAYDPMSKGLVVIQEEKQQDMMLTGCKPLLGIDVWEHAYYLKYQNKRADYISAFMNVVNWAFVQDQFDRATA